MHPWHGNPPPTPMYNLLEGLVNSVPLGADIGRDESAPLSPYRCPRVVLLLDLLYPTALFVHSGHCFTEHERSLLDWFRHMFAFQLMDLTEHGEEIYATRLGNDPPKPECVAQQALPPTAQALLVYYQKYYGAGHWDCPIFAAVARAAGQYHAATTDPLDPTGRLSPTRVVLLAHVLHQFFAMTARMVGQERYIYLLDQYHHDGIRRSADYCWYRAAQQLNSRKFRAVRAFDSRASKAPAGMSGKSPILRSMSCSPFSVPPVSEPANPSAMVVPDMPELSSAANQPPPVLLAIIQVALARALGDPGNSKHPSRARVPLLWWLLDDQGIFRPRRIRYILFQRVVQELAAAAPEGFGKSEGRSGFVWKSDAGDSEASRSDRSYDSSDDYYGEHSRFRTASRFHHDDHDGGRMHENRLDRRHRHIQWGNLHEHRPIEQAPRRDRDFDDQDNFDDEEYDDDGYWEYDEWDDDDEKEYLTEFPAQMHDLFLPWVTSTDPGYAAHYVAYLDDRLAPALVRARRRNSDPLLLRGTTIDPYSVTYALCGILVMCLGLYAAVPLAVSLVWL